MGELEKIVKTQALNFLFSIYRQILKLISYLDCQNGPVPRSKQSPKD